MQASTNRDSEQLVRKSHRTLWGLLALISLLALGAVLNLMEHDTSLRHILPVVFTLTVLFLAVATRGTSPSNPAMRAVLADELRQASLARAQRNGLFAALLIQAPMCAALEWFGSAHPAALMACMTAFTGATAVIISMLCYDR